jgi:hypothetical protein
MHGACSSVFANYSDPVSNGVTETEQASIRAIESDSFQ